MRKVSLIASLAVLLLPLGILAESHEDERPPLNDVWLVVPKQGMVGQFEDAVRTHMAFRADAGESRSWNVYRPVLGDNLNVYHFRSCCFDYAGQDAYIAEDQEKGFAQNWNENVDQYVDHYHHYLEYNDWENSHWPEGETGGPYYGATAWTWKEGAGPGPNEIRKKFSQMAISDGWAEAGNNWLWLSRIGGKPTIAVVTSFANYADMAPPEQSFFEFIAEQLDSEEEAGKLFTQFGSGFTSSEYTVWVHQPELSTPGDED